jgi:hypothetical protein
MLPDRYKIQLKLKGSGDAYEMKQHRLQILSLHHKKTGWFNGNFSSLFFLKKDIIF